MSDEPAGIYADRFYEMDPQHEEVIFGDDLRDGMIVLLESGFSRGDPVRAFSGPADDDYTRYEVDRCRESSRWCTVTRLTRMPCQGLPGSLVRFVAVYADGTQRVRTYNSQHAWYVKRASIPGGVR